MHFKKVELLCHARQTNAMVEQAVVYTQKKQWKSSAVECKKRVLCEQSLKVKLFPKPSEKSMQDGGMKQDVLLVLFVASLATC